MTMFVSGVKEIWRKVTQGKRTRGSVKQGYINNRCQEAFTDEVIFQLNPDDMKASQVTVLGHSIPYRRNDKCKGPEASVVKMSKGDNSRRRWQYRVLRSSLQTTLKVLSFILSEQRSHQKVLKGRVIVQCFKDYSSLLLCFHVNYLCNMRFSISHTTIKNCR